MREFIKKDAPCTMCGVIMHDVTSRKKYCPKCARLREKMKKLDSTQPRKKRKSPEKKVQADIKPAVEDRLSRDARIARDVYHTTYGKYISMLKMQAESAQR